MKVLRCAECHSLDLSLECLVRQDPETGQLEVACLMDKGHVCERCGEERDLEEFDPRASTTV